MRVGATPLMAVGAAAFLAGCQTQGSGCGDEECRQAVGLAHQVVWAEYLVRNCPAQFRYRPEYRETRANGLKAAARIFEGEKLNAVIERTGNELMIGGCSNMANHVRRNPEKNSFLFRAVLR